MIIMLHDNLYLEWLLMDADSRLIIVWKLTLFMLLQA